MANTLNLGNGDWATKENSLLGYNSESGNYKPLPFDFTRASSATVVNKSGLIETVQSGIPRIDFLGNTSGALLLEPQRTNLIPYSDRFNSPPFWSQVALTVSNNATISPDGTLNASKITRTSTSGNARLVHSSVAVSSGAKATLSAFFKYNDTDEIILFSPITLQGKRFSLQNATAGADFVSAPDGYGIENYGNGWYRFYIVVTAPSTSVDFTIYVQNNATTSIYLFGAQIEQGSYSTSLINTQGSAVTRVADEKTNVSLPSNIAPQSEGTIFFNINRKGSTGVTNQELIVLETPSRADGGLIRVLTQSTKNVIRVLFQIDGGIPFDVNVLGANTPFNTDLKIAIAFKSGQNAIYINGIETNTGTGTFTIPEKFDNFYLNFSREASTFKDVRLYNTRLSNSELAALTS